MNYADDNLIKYNTDLREVASKLVQKYQASGKLPENDKELLVSFYLTKASKTHAAIMLLCNSGYGMDAVWLGRTIFEMLVTMKYILADPTNERINQFTSHGWIFKKEIHGNLLQYNPQIKGFDGFNKKIEEIKENAKLAQEKYNYKAYSGWSYENMHAMAKEVGEENDFLTCYGIQSSFGHSLSTCTNEYVRKEGDKLIFDAGPNKNYVNFALTAAFSSYIKLCIEVDKFLSLGFEDEFIKLTSIPLPSI